MRSFIAAAGILGLIVAGCQAQNEVAPADSVNQTHEVNDETSKPVSEPVSAAVEPVNAGHQASQPLPFAVERVADFSLPWRIAFLPDGRMLITEKTGALWLVTQQGEKTPVQNVPAVVYGGQGGMLGVYASPFYAKDHSIYLTYSEPQEKGSGLALTRAQLVLSNDAAKLENIEVLWHDPAGGRGGQFGGAVAFSPDSKYLYLAVGDRQRMTPAQDPNSPLGKTLRLTLDGKPAPGNPQEGKTGASTLDIINPPRDTELAKTAPTVFSYTYTTPNQSPAEIWTSGHRNAYGLAFAPDGKLWTLEHAPRGGDELNLLEPGKNYGWPLVCYGKNYNGVPIPSPDTRPDLAKPAIYWDPVIAPGGMVFYDGAMFPQWKGSLLVSGLGSKSLLRIAFDNQGNPTAANRWDMDRRLRDVAVAPDGAIWVIEDSRAGALFRLTPLAE